MKKIVSNLNERVLVSIGNVSYDSWGCTYLGDTELYLKLPFVSLKRKSKDKCFTYDINMNTGNLVLSQILVSYDDDSVYFEKEKLGEYSYDCQLNVLVFDGIDTFITKEDLVLNKDIFEKYILDILKRQSYFNDLMINKLISFNYDSLRQIFNIFLTGQSIYLESLIDNKAYTTLKILLNSPNIISINTNNCQQVLAILNTLEKVGLKSDIEVDIFTMAFKNNINKFDNIFETIGNVINAFGVSNTQMINKLILVINEIATINKRNYYGYSDFTENNFFKTFKILDILYSLSNDNNDITGISNYLVKSIFKTYQCGLQFNDIIEYLSLYKDYMMIKNVYDDENNFELYPKFLKHKHDKIVNLFNNKDSGNTLSELEKISFKKEVTKAKKYEYENDKYVITVPNNSLEVIEEGKALGHCVGGYCRSIAKGHTTILFLRYKVEQSKSFMTLEVNNNVLKQAKKKINRTPNKEEIEFIREWACKKNILIESF